MNFVAIDFETANNRRNSACSLGVAVVSDGVICESKEWRFRPPKLHFNVKNVQLHGITAQSVANCELLSDQWDEINPYFESKLVIAHYASFDISVLKQSLDSFNIQYPTFNYTCSWLIAKKTWPSMKSYSLPYLSDYLNIETTHHDALSDALVCAELVISACKKWNTNSLSSVESFTNLTRGRLSDKGHIPVSSKSSSSSITSNEEANENRGCY